MTTLIAGSMSNNLCSPNPCKNNGMCKLSVNKAFYTCFCSKKYTGKWNVFKIIKSVFFINSTHYLIFKGINCTKAIDLTETKRFPMGKSLKNFENLTSEPIKIK